MKFTLEQIQMAKSAKSAEELLTLSKENGMEITEEESKNFFDELHKNGELSDEELNVVAGGKGDDSTEKININNADPCCPNCGDNLYIVMNGNSKPVTYSDDNGEYNVYGCVKCKIRYRHYWNGDFWTKN